MIQIFILGLICIGVLFTSCESESSTSEIETENYVNASIDGLQDASKAGKAWCFEFVFPISIIFSDGTEVSVGGFDELRGTLRDYVEENGRDAEKPDFVYPLEVFSEDGEMITLSEASELRSLTKSCVREGFRNRLRNKFRGRKGITGLSCYSLVFPVTIVFRDGTSVMVADREEAKAAKQSYKEANPDERAKARLVFPISLTLEDESVVEVPDKEALKALKQACVEQEAGEN